ncbi:MAG: FkbM family methyltransferase [Planctomycetes bacterium]|nr:FkbM family methyltransferase [Planctomycetota bacterium]MBI3457037.1 FkbM family methyltransferase [Candidatus Rokubacteria bacterium]
MKRYDPSAIGSDIARSRRQYLARRLGALVVRLLRLNSGGFLTTEIVQQIAPVCTIPTAFGVMRCRGGHGRLRWRALTFHTEEPETVKWLETIGADGFLWDIGANVGLYAIYAARYGGCRVLAVEPEAQNFALLIENIVLNGVQDLVIAANLAITDEFGIGKLRVHALTKSGAYNQFSRLAGLDRTPRTPEGGTGIEQVQIGLSLDDLVKKFGYPCPTHIKVDVDGNEPEIIAGGSRVLQEPGCRSVLIEVQRNDPAHLAMVDRLKHWGFTRVSERSNWESRANREREKEHPAVNMIFVKM